MPQQTVQFHIETNQPVTQCSLPASDQDFYTSGRGWSPVCTLHVRSTALSDVSQMKLALLHATGWQTQSQQLWQEFRLYASQRIHYEVWCTFNGRFFFFFFWVSMSVEVTWLLRISTNGNVQALGLCFCDELDLMRQLCTVGSNCICSEIKLKSSKLSFINFMTVQLCCRMTVYNNQTVFQGDHTDLVCLLATVDPAVLTTRNLQGLMVHLCQRLVHNILSDVWVIGFWNCWGVWVEGGLAELPAASVSLCSRCCNKLQT